MQQPRDGFQQRANEGERSQELRRRIIKSPGKKLHMQFAFTPKKEIKMKQFRIHLLGVIARLLNARKCRLWATATGLGFVLVFTLIVPFTVRQTAHAQGSDPKAFVPPVVFQAAGKDAASIQSSVDAFRAALGNPNNGNAGPLDTGHREINWDGAGGVDTTTTVPVTPFNVFLNTRGSQFTTPGIGLTQAPASGGPQGGLAVLLNNSSYGTIFKAFSNTRLFTPV